LKIGVVIGPASRKNSLTFVGAPVQDTDFASLFHFPHHCGKGNFRRFNQHFSYIQRHIFATLGEMIEADNVINPQRFASDQVDIRI